VTLLAWDLEPGTRLLGRYEVAERLAEGAVATVYRARDERGGRDVALKVLDDLRADDPVAHARLEREFEVLSDLSHPGVGRCLARGAHEGLVLLVLELLEGETLAQRLDRGRLAVDEALRTAGWLARALAAVHEAGVLHRDLKPDNVIMEPSRGPVIVDFGLAWFSAAATLTRTGALLGSPAYTAPEVFAGGLADARADVWSLGAILFEMLTGRPVWLAADITELALQRHREEAPSVAALRPEVPAGLSECVRRALADDPGERFASASELADGLEAGRPAWPAFAQAGARCEACGARPVLGLSFCPGCGADAETELEPGRHAVQLDAVPDPQACADWIVGSRRSELGQTPARLPERLRRPPLPLATGLSAASAHRLCAAARKQGNDACVRRPRWLVGPRLAWSPASLRQVLGWASIHLLATLAWGAATTALRSEAELIFLGPPAVSVLLAAALWWWNRRPVIRVGRVREETAAAAHLRTRLRALETPRARSLAALVVRRALPLLAPGSSLPLAPQAEAAEEALEAALEAVEQVDAQAAWLACRPRSRVPAVDVAEWTEAAVAHDLAARNALDAARAVSAALC